jgi:structural maintenance of chromosome 3 (chondroitin sulfate proteoglycan 6)
MFINCSAGSSVMAAYVEIIFDNSDGRLSVESEEVVLRRTVGHKKDEFFVNRKRVQKAEVQSLLESAGFSKSNPYYIVQQGKVANLCVMKDTDRLTLLKDIAGTTVYEERRNESLTIMKETSTKQDRIQEVLTFIEERLAELEKEKEELSEYDLLDKKRRSLEYTLYDKELEKASEQLQSIDITRETEREKHGEVHTELQAIQDEIQKQEDALTTLKSGLDRITTRKLTKKTEIDEILKRHTEIQVRLQEAEASNSAQNSERSRLEVELVDLESQIAETEKELAHVDPLYDTLNSDQIKSIANLETIRARIEQLYGKQGRGRQFSTKEERNIFLQEQIDALERQVVEKQSYISINTDSVKQEGKRVDKDKRLLDQAKNENKSRSTGFDMLTAQITDTIQVRNQLQDARKSSWLALETFQEQITNAKQDLDRGRQQLNSVLPRSIAQGLQIVEEIAKEKKLKGYYGPVIDNFSLKSDVFRTAVEVAAGNSLFHVIVDSNETAALLMKELEARKGGRITFLPMNRISAPNVTYPDALDVRPIIEVALDYDPDFDVAIRHVFGSKLIARDLEAASHYSKECNLDAITRDGDLVNRRGGFEGGFHDERVSKMAAVQKIRDANNTIVELTKQEVILRQTTDKTELDVTEILRNLQKLESDRENIRNQIEQFAREIVNREKSLDTMIRSVQNQRDGLKEVDREVVSLSQQISFFKQEQKSDLCELDTTEKDELVTLTNQERVCQTALEGSQKELTKTNSRRETLRADLRNNLLKRKAEISASLASTTITQSSEKTDLTALHLEKQHLSSILKSVENEQEEIEIFDSGQLNEITKAERLLESYRISEQKALRSINEAAKMHDKLLNKRTMLMETVQTKQKLIRELGTLPRSELMSVKVLSEKQLLDEMVKVNERLKKFAGVNRKALDQYVSFNDQRDTLLDRQSQLNTESESIQKLVDNLDIQKEEAILRTFRGVSMHFSEVFSELVKGGQGRLVMRTSDDMNDIEGGEELDQVSDIDSDNDDTQVALKKKAPSVSTFQGVQVRVSFSGVGQQYEMRQLSGGQKAIVALALIFAIQRCDPAPFYLFDEIDQALDANYRLEVARLIERQATDKTNPAQFITTTFRPEMVSVAHRHYGIALVNKTSSIYPLTKKDAENFVLDLMNEEEAIGAVTSVHTYGGIGSASGSDPEVDTNGNDTYDIQDLDASYDSNDNEEIENPDVVKARAIEEDTGVRLEGDSSDSDDENDPFNVTKEKEKPITKRIEGTRRKVRRS